jgi:hypothetical protein
LSTANVSIAALIALLGKLINFKKDLAKPADADAQALETSFAAEKPETTHLSVRLELWPEIPFAAQLPHERLLAQAGEELDLVQLLKMLDYNLAELVHLVKSRNELIRRMNAHQSEKGALPHDGLKLYIRYAHDIARTVDENLFFADRAIDRVRDAARRLLPARLHGAIADVGLKPETTALMPPKDLIKGFVK